MTLSKYARIVLAALCLCVMTHEAQAAGDLGTIAVTTAVTGQSSTPITGLGKVQSLSLIARLTYTSGGTTIKVYVQTSLDQGSTWYDIKQFAFTTAGAVKGAAILSGSAVTTTALTTGTASDDTAVQGIVGDQLRYVVTSTGTYAAGTSVDVLYQAH